jgi:hypothetical protein
MSGASSLRRERTRTPRCSSPTRATRTSARNPGKTQPYWNDGGVFRRKRAERNDFNIHMGDTIYSDSEVPGLLEPIALTVQQKWDKYKVNLGNRASVRYAARPPCTHTGTTTSS